MAARKEYELLMKLTAAIGSNFNSTFQTAMNTTKRLQDSLSNIQKVQKKVDGYKETQNAIAVTKASVQGLVTRHTELQQKLAATIQKEKDLKKALDTSAQATGKDTEEYKRLEAELKKAQDQKEKLTGQVKKTAAEIENSNKKIDEQENRLSELSEELKAAGVNTERLAQENDKLQQAYDRVKKSQEDIARVNQAIEENKEAISATKTELVKTVGVVAGAGAAFYKGFIEPAANFEAQMSVVKAISGATAEDMTKLNALAKKMGATTQFTAIESGKALEYMSMAGWDTNAMMNGLGGVMNLAAASGEDLATVSDIVTDAMTAFNMSSDEANRFADVLAATATSSNTNVGIMGETFKGVAPLAGAMGYSIEDMSVAIGLMANAGVKGSKAGTSLKNIIANLADPSSEVTDAMNALNLSLVNNDGTTKSFEEVVKSLRSSFSGLTESEKAAYAATIGGKQGMAGLLAVVNSGESDFAKLTEQINDCTGAAEQMAATRLDNLNGDITLAKSAWDGLATTIGELFLPNMRSAVQSVTDILNKINEFVQENPELVKTLAKVAGGLAAVRVGSLAGKLGFLEMKGGILSVAKSFLGFKANIAEATAAAATGGGQIASLGSRLSGYFSGVRTSIGGVGSSIDSLAGGKMSSLSSKIGSGLQNGILKPLSGLGNKVTGALGGVSGKITGFFGNIGHKVAAGPLGKIGGVFGNIGKSAGAILGGPLKGLGSLFGGLFGKAMPVIAIISALSILFMKLRGEDISGFIKPIKQAFEDMKPTLQNVMEQFMQLGKDLMPVIITTMEKLAPLLGDLIKNILPIITELIKEIVPMLIKIVGDILPVILNIIGALAPLLTTVITKILPVALDLLKILLPIITSLATSVLPIIVSVLETLMPIITDLIGGVLPILMSVLQALMPVIQTLANLFSAVLGAAIEGIKPVIDGLMTMLKGIIAFVAGVFTGDWGKAWEGVKNIFSGIIDAIVGVWNSIVGIFKSIGDFFGDLFGGGDKTLNIDVNSNVGVSGENEPVKKFAKGANYTPDTFIAGDVNGKGGELITGAKGRKVFTAAETNAIFDNIKMAKAINSALPASDSDTPKSPTITERVGGFIGALKNVAASRADELTQQPLSVMPDSYGGGNQAFTIRYNPAIYIDGNKPEDLEEKLKRNNESLLQMFKDFLRQQRENERRTNYA